MEALTPAGRPGATLQGRRVLVTGHTGFKGAWLSLWLAEVGAEVHGVALAPDDAQQDLFALVEGRNAFTSSQYLDIGDTDATERAFAAVRPEVVLHLAAQPIVRRSYVDPVTTFRSNVMGTVNVLEAARRCEVGAVVCVTSDKCYENVEQIWPYREIDPVGGHDPYSASKGCSELVVASYSRSFADDGEPLVASARAGNVIGGGDYAEDRLVPDFFRAIEAGTELVIRRPNATRPWQHVLESLSGYLALADALVTHGRTATGAWNFGPEPHDVRTVGEFLGLLGDAVGAAAPKVRVEVDGPHESSRLALDVSKARFGLGWSAVLSPEERAGMTADWYLADEAARPALMLEQAHLVSDRLAT